MVMRLPAGGRVGFHMASKALQMGARLPASSARTMHCAREVFGRNFSTFEKPKAPPKENMHQGESWKKFGHQDFRAKAREEHHKAKGDTHSKLAPLKMERDWSQDLGMCAILDNRLKLHLDELPETPTKEDVTLTTLELHNMTHNFQHQEIERCLGDIRRTFREEVGLREQHHKYLEDTLKKIKTMGVMDPDLQGDAEKTIEGLIASNLHAQNELNTLYADIEKQLIQRSEMEKEMIVDEKLISSATSKSENALQAIALVLPKLTVKRAYLAADLVVRVVSSLNVAYEKDLKTPSQVNEREGTGEALLEFNATARVSQILFGFVKDHLVDKTIDKAHVYLVKAEPALEASPIDLAVPGKNALSTLVDKFAKKLTAKKLTQEKATQWLEQEVGISVRNAICAGLMKRAENSTEARALNSGSLLQYESARINSTKEAIALEHLVAKGLLKISKQSHKDQIKLHGF